MMDAKSTAATSGRRSSRPATNLIKTVQKEVERALGSSAYGHTHITVLYDILTGIYRTLKGSTNASNPEVLIRSLHARFGKPSFTISAAPDSGSQPGTTLFDRAAAEVRFAEKYHVAILRYSKSTGIFRTLCGITETTDPETLHTQMINRFAKPPLEASSQRLAILASWPEVKSFFDSNATNCMACLLMGIKKARPGDYAFCYRHLNELTIQDGTKNGFQALLEFKRGTNINTNMAINATCWLPMHICRNMNHNAPCYLPQGSIKPFLFSALKDEQILRVLLNGEIIEAPSYLSAHERLVGYSGNYDRPGVVVLTRFLVRHMMGFEFRTVKAI